MGSHGFTEKDGSAVEPRTVSHQEAGATSHTGISHLPIASFFACGSHHHKLELSIGSSASSSGNSSRDFLEPTPGDWRSLNLASQSEGSLVPSNSPRPHRSVYPHHRVKHVVSVSLPAFPSVRDAENATGSHPPSGHMKSQSIASLSEEFSLDPDPLVWGVVLEEGEHDDSMHEPDENLNAKGHIFTDRGLRNVGCLFFLLLALLSLFIIYPVASYLISPRLSALGGFNLGGINASGQIPALRGPIDIDTPKDLHTIQSYYNPSEELQLVFSDEFNNDGRTFYPGDDPYWEAVDLNYWATNDMEWYDPSAIITKNGALQVTLSKEENHGLQYKGGMMSTWNKFCFTGGLFQAAVTLPGINNVMGLWPAVWAMGNLGRAGYGASLEGLWPYTYDACDVGTVANQTVNGVPKAATINGDKFNGGALSYLPGQRLSRCTCPGESHPGPFKDGEFVGRSAPEIDMFEALVGSNGQGQVSQSAQWAPFNEAYQWFNTSDNLIIPDPKVTHFNSYQGGVFQQATSCLSTTDQNCYQLKKGCFSVYGFEYRPGYADGYISWINNNKLSWTMLGGGTAQDTRVDISARPIPQEPMYLIVNLGMSRNFGFVDLEHLTFPAVMSIDWIRVYQPKDSINVGCNPPDYPTAEYIEKYKEAYSNPNLTTWRDDYKQTFPKNKFLGEC